MTKFVGAARESRRRKLGIDSVSRVVWRHWEPGNEYVRKIQIKNVDVRTQTIEYKLPQRKFTFFMDFPEPVVLSSGMSFDLEVCFRPSEMVEIHDVIEINVMGRGGYTVHLDCETPYAEVQVPPQHDFAYCAVGMTATHTLRMRNAGTVPLEFVWEVPEPFRLEPARGALSEGESMSLTASFTPSEACTLVAQAVCRMLDNDQIIASTRFSGIGKYPFIRVAGDARRPGENTLILDFGRLLAGATRCLEFQIENPSLVDAHFSVATTDGERGAEKDAVACPFRVVPNSGRIPRGEARRFRVTFAPAAVASALLGHVYVRAMAGNAVLVQLRGAAAAPVVRLSTRTVDFGDVCLDEDDARYGVDVTSQPVARRQRRFLLLRNTADVPVAFFVLRSSPGAAFAVDPLMGVVPARGSARLRVEFHPTQPINYLRRLMVLTEHAGSLLHVDLFGSAYDRTVRPQPLNAAEVAMFFARQLYGYGASTPEEIAAIAETIGNVTGPRAYAETLSQWHLLSQQQQQQQQQQQNLVDTTSTTVATVPPTCITNATILKSMTTQHGRVSLNAVNGTLVVGAFRLDTECVVFDAYMSNPRHVVVYNDTASPATALWCVPRGAAVCVTPPCDDIPPYSHYTFAVGLMPGAPLLTEEFLECYVNFKQMRSFRLVPDGGFTPPYCLTLRCHRQLTIDDPSAGSLAPFVSVPRAVAFPPCRVGDLAHAVVEIVNTGDIALMYTVTLQFNGYLVKSAVYVEENTGVQTPRQLFCHPPRGIVAPHSRAPIVLSYEPPCAARFHGEATITLNGSARDELRVTLYGESFAPHLIIEDSSMIVFPPTCVTGEARRILRVSNPTCISIAFDVLTSPALTDVIRFDPPYGVLEPGEEMELAANFRPLGAEVYEGHVNFFIADSGKMQEAATGSGPDWTEKDRRLLACPCMAEGRHAVVEVEPVTFEHEGPALQKTTFEWTIYNSGVCEVCYEVRWIATSDPARWSGQPAPPPRLSHNSTGKLAARSHTVVLVTLQPQAGESSYVLYILVGGTGVTLGAIPHPASLHEVWQHPHCEVRLRGTRPALQITDVRSLQQHRSQLWYQLAINHINAVLAAPVQASDVEPDSFAFPQYVAGLKPILMDMGVGTNAHGDKVILLRLDNAAACPAAYRFWYPMEHEGGSETWFIEDAELDEVRYILSHRLVEINPREGTIPVGSHAVVTLTYRHIEIGTHRLPVLLRLDKGKKVLLVLNGCTVEGEANTLAFHHPDVYRLHPVALGDLEPPLQLTAVENTAPQEVTYVVQEELSQLVAERNYGFPVFQCLNPTGTIPPGGSVQLHWYFRPLEAREYRLEVALRTVNGQTYTLRFSGMGYHPSRLPVELCRAMMCDAFLPIPTVPALRMPLDQCPIALTLNVMRVGPAPCFSLHRRVCYLENRHASLTYEFIWDTPIAPGSTTLSVTPASGALAPGQRLRCTLALHCGSLSQVIEEPVLCHVRRRTIATPSRVADPIDRVSGGTATTGRFIRSTCTKRPLPDTPRTAATSTSAAAAGGGGYGDEGRPVSAVEGKCPSTTAAAEGAAAAATATSTSSTAGKEMKGPVAVHALEVLVQARVMSSDEYERLFGARALQQTHFPELAAHHVDPMRLSDDRRAATPSSSCTRNEAAVAHQVLDELLRSIVARPHVRAALTETVKEPAPSYREMIYVPTVSATVSSKCPQTPHSVLRRDGVVTNMVEDLLADAVLQVVSTLTEGDETYQKGDRKTQKGGKWTARSPRQKLKGEEGKDD